MERWFLGVVVAFGCSVILAPVGGAPLTAQDSLSFAVVNLSLGSAWIAHPGRIDDHWTTTPGLQGSILTRYGRGALRLSLEREMARARRQGVPDYTAYFPTAEWGPTGTLPGGFRWSAGVGLGVYWMRFQGLGNNPNETEMAALGTALFRRGLGGHWTASAGGRVRRIFTTEPVDQGTLFVELGRDLSLPDRIRPAFSGTGSDARIRPQLDEGAAPDSSEVTEVPPRASHRLGNTLTASELRNAGVFRLADLFRALPGWDRTTVDLRTSWAAPGGLDPLYEAGFDVLVDGAPVPIEVLGVRALDRLPLALEDVDSVRIAGGGTLDGGSVAGRAALEFWTSRRVENGLDVFAVGLADNATDDPGPFLHVEPSRNIDKLGKGYELGGNLRLGPFHASGGYKLLADFVTDPAAGDRTLSYVVNGGRYPVIRTLSPRLALSWEHGRGWHTLRLGRSRRLDYFFLPALGFEVPAESELEHVGAAGRVRLSPSVGWSYSAHTAWDRLVEAQSIQDLSYDLHTRRRGARADLTWERRHRASLGAGMEQETLTSRFLPGRVDRRTLSARASGTLVGAPGSLGMRVEARRARGELGGGAYLDGETALPGSVRARVTLWHERRAVTEQGGYWGLHDDGYGFLGSAGVEVEEQGSPRALRKTGVEVALSRVGLGSAFELRPFARATRFTGLSLARPAFVGGAPFPVHEGPIKLFRSSGGSVGVAGLEARWNPEPRVDFELHYRWLSALTGDDPFRSAWGAVPAHRMVQRISWTLRPDLMASLHVEARGSTRWPEYRPMGRERLAGSILVDVSMEKSLWDGRIRLGARIGDLLDQERQLHPLGAAPGLTMGVRGAARL